MAVEGVYFELVSPLLVAGALGLVTALVLRRYDDPATRRFLVRLVLAGIGIRLLAMAAIHLTVGPYVFAPDASYYEALGRELVRGEASLFGGERPIPAWSVVIAAIYRVAGSSPLGPAMLNVFLGTWVGLPVYHLALRLSGDHRRVARWSAVLAVFFPSLVLWSTLTIRDTAVVFVITGITLLFDRLRDRVPVGRLVALFAGLAVLAAFREYLFVLIALGAGVGLIVARSDRPVRSFVVGSLVMFVVVFAYHQTGVGGRVLGDVSLERAETIRRGFQAFAGSAYGEGYDISTPSGALSFLPVGLVHFLLAPFPWAIGSLLQMATLPETLVWYALFPVTLYGIYVAVRADLRRHMVVLSVILTITLSYALVAGNVGTAYRHRAQMLPILFIFTGAGLWELYRRRQERRRARRPSRTFRYPRQASETRGS